MGERMGAVARLSNLGRSSKRLEKTAPDVCGGSLASETKREMTVAPEGVEARGGEVRGRRA